MKPSYLLLILTALSITTAPLLAQTTRLIDPLDPAYRDIEQLIDGGLIDRLSLAQRPLSRAAFARAFQEAATKLNVLETAGPGPTLAGAVRGSGLRLDFYRELIGSLRERLELPDSGTIGRLPPRIAPIRLASLDVTATDEPTQVIPRANGIGSIDASLNTMLAYREGRPLVEGTSTLVETTHTLESNHLAVLVTPQLSLLAPTDSSRRAALRLQELQLRTLLGNVAIDVGREYAVWGQGRDVGLLNSTNSPPLDLIRLSGDEPFTLPLFLHYLGPTRFSIFYSDLGGDQNYPHAYLVGYQGNILPTSSLELGFSVYTKSGGHGAPRATASARLIDLLPFLDASAYNNIIGTRGDFQFSDHYAGFQGRWRLRPLGGSLYWEVLLNDFDIRRLRSVLWEDAGHIAGVDLPPLSSSGRLRASLEYHHTGLRYYEHHQFTSGQTLHNTLTGDPLGPDAQGAYAYLDWFRSVRQRFSAEFALEQRSHDIYASIPDPDFRFLRVLSEPKERQARMLSTWQLLPSRNRLGSLFQLGYAHTLNFDFVQGNRLDGFVSRAALQVQF